MVFYLLDGLRFRQEWQGGSFVLLPCLHSRKFRNIPRANRIQLLCPFKGSGARRHFIRGFSPFDYYFYWENVEKIIHFIQSCGIISSRFHREVSLLLSARQRFHRESDFEGPSCLWLWSAQARVCELYQSTGSPGFPSSASTRGTGMCCSTKVRHRGRARDCTTCMTVSGVR